MEQWFAGNWFEILGTIFGGGGLWFTAFAIYKQFKADRAGNLIAITTNHREVWKIYLLSKDVQRVLDASADISKAPITPAEAVFVNLVVQQMNSVYYTMSDRLVVEYDGLKADIADFISLPIPQAVWSNSKPLQNHDFADFVELSQKQK